MRKKIDILNSETDEDEDVSDVDPEELQKMLEVSFKKQFLTAYKRSGGPEIIFEQVYCEFSFSLSARFACIFFKRINFIVGENLRLKLLMTRGHGFFSEKFS